jgi:mannose-1-phosphate guanylyltransferase/mannose-6-phosphate isomerase
MEKSLNVVTTRIDTEFTDIGNWKSLYRITEKDKDNNVTIGNVVALNTKNSYLRSDKRLIAAVGLSDIVVVDTPDVILVADKESSQEISNMVSILEEKNRPEATTSQQVYRLWGYYKIIESSPMYQIRNVCVLPRNCISLQMHRYRGEHWVIISGQAKITRGDDIIYLTENQSTYIPPKMVHSVENTSDEILEILEIQMGSYVNDDDVVRFENIYERGNQKFNI